MGKFNDLTTLALSMFATTEWQAEDIVTQPSNFTGKVSGNEYIRVSVVTGNNKLEYTNLNSMVGQMVIEIFTKAGEGPSRAAQIADTLDKYLVGKIFSSQVGDLQIGPSLTAQGKQDIANPALFKTLYTVNLSYFGK